MMYKKWKHTTYILKRCRVELCWLIDFVRLLHELVINSFDSRSLYIPQPLLRQHMGGVVAVGLHNRFHLKWLSRES